MRLHSKKTQINVNVFPEHHGCDGERTQVEKYRQAAGGMAEHDICAQQEQMSSYIFWCAWKNKFKSIFDRHCHLAVINAAGSIFLT